MKRINLHTALLNRYRFTYASKETIGLGLYTIQSHILFTWYGCSGASITVDITGTMRLTDRQNHSASLRLEWTIFSTNRWFIERKMNTATSRRKWSDMWYLIILSYQGNFHMQNWRIGNSFHHLKTNTIPILLINFLIPILKSFILWRLIYKFLENFNTIFEIIGSNRMPR